MEKPRREALFEISVRPSWRLATHLALLPAPVEMRACRPCEPSQECMAETCRREGTSAILAGVDARGVGAYGGLGIQRALGRDSGSLGVEEKPDDRKDQSSVGTEDGAPEEQDARKVKGNAAGSAERVLDAEESVAPEAKRASKLGIGAEAERDGRRDGPGGPDGHDSGLTGLGPERDVDRASEAVGDTKEDALLAFVLGGEEAVDRGELVDRDLARADSDAAKVTKGVEIEQDAAVGRGSERGLDVRVDEGEVGGVELAGAADTAGDEVIPAERKPDEICAEADEVRDLRDVRGRVAGQAASERALGVDAKFETRQDDAAKGRQADADRCREAGRDRTAGRDGARRGCGAASTSRERGRGDGQSSRSTDRGAN